MAGDPMVAEPAPTPLGKADASFAPENDEIPAATYEKLRRLAAEYLRSERPNHTLQATALLHEAFLRVLKRPDHAWRDEAHVIAFAARAMRRILISYGVARTRDKSATLISLQWMRRWKSSNWRIRGRRKLLSYDFSPGLQSMKSRPH